MKRFASAPASGFTLLELLLVITIIALLAGMIFPATTQLVDKAHTTKCMSNLRQIGMAANMAATDNDNIYLAIEGDPKNPVYGPGDNAKPLNEALVKYGVTSAVLQCASDLKGPNWFGKVGYSYMWLPLVDEEGTASVNLYFRGRSRPAKLSRVRMATDYESVHAPANPGGGKTMNVLYADGHVTLR